MSLSDYKITFQDKGYVSPASGTIPQSILSSYVTAQDMNSLKYAVNSTIDQVQQDSKTIRDVYSQFFEMKSNFNSYEQFIRNARDYITTVSSNVDGSLSIMDQAVSELSSAFESVRSSNEWMQYQLNKRAYTVTDKQKQVDFLTTQLIVQKTYMNHLLKVQNERISNQNDLIGLLMRKVNGQAVNEEEFKMIQLQGEALKVLQQSIQLDLNKTPYVFGSQITNEQLSQLDQKIVQISGQIQQLPVQQQQQFDMTVLQKTIDRLNGIDFVFGTDAERTSGMCTKLGIYSSVEDHEFGIQLIPGRGGCTVSWGDGSESQVYYMNPITLKNRFTKYNSYTVTLSGCGYSFKVTDGKKMLTKVQSLAGSIRNYHEMFSGCENLAEIPSGFVLNEYAKTAQRMFCGCNSLQMDISSMFPEFKLPFVDLQAMMSGCVSVSGKAPSANLWKAPSGITFDSLGCFAQCSGLSNYNKIPSKWK